MIERRKTRQLHVGSVAVGGDAPIAVQSMTNTHTDDAAATLEQIQRLADAGCDIIRCAVPDMAAAEGLKTICKESPVPVIADIHFDYKLALAAIEHGADKIRINPGNIGSTERVRAVVDATRDLLVNVLPYHPFLIKPNNHELGEIVGKVLTTDAEIVAAARTLQEKGARNVLVSMAGDGALLLDEQGQVHRIGCPKGKVVNSVGAGDSMVAGFVAGYLQSRSYAQALRLGTACGSATAFSLGLATKEKIDELLAQL